MDHASDWVQLPGRGMGDGVSSLPNAYLAAIKVEPSKQAASPENIRQLILKRPLKEWPCKEELYGWDTLSD
jgi:hypothetical protein